ncbi:MAG: pantetheine-phosphate adenylyltransferase [Clostridia bacterium]
MRKAVYPGSFDPLTLGHIDIIKRAAKNFDELIVAVVRNPSKNPLFSAEERVEMIEHATKDLPNVKADHFQGLLIHYVESVGSEIIIKGLRAITDFEYEFQMALMNRKLDSNIDTMFLMTRNKYSYLSSSMVKEVFKLGGDVSCLVPEYVLEKLKEKIKPEVKTI